MTGNFSNRWKLFWRPTTGRNLILARAFVDAYVREFTGAWTRERMRACVLEMHDIDAMKRRRHSWIDIQPRGYYADVISPANTLPGPVPIRLTGNAILFPFAFAFVFCIKIIFCSFRLPFLPVSFVAPSIDKQLISVVIKSHNVQTKSHFLSTLQPLRNRWFHPTLIRFIETFDRHHVTYVFGSRR